MHACLPFLVAYTFTVLYTIYGLTIIYELTYIVSAKPRQQGNTWNLETYYTQPSEEKGSQIYTAS